MITLRVPGGVIDPETKPYFSFFYPIDF